MSKTPRTRPRRGRTKIPPELMKELLGDQQPIGALELARLAKMRPSRWGSFRIRRQTL